MDFILGCNYWASNAGTEMWLLWDEECVRSDLKKLSEYGVTHLRVFPNWRDFQPAVRMYGYQGIKREIRHKNGELFDNEAYLDNTMLERFSRFCDICEEKNIKIIVSLLTGWMSGRLFVPPVLEEKNLYTDSLALKLEMKFIRGFVKRFKNRKCIIAWGLGNECNCLSESDADAAAAWTGIISNAIKVVDNERPVISDMHGLGIDNVWKIKDQAEYCDILTTHPYPHFVPHCFGDGMVSFRTLMHSPCESKYYSDIGGKPCFTEEIGNLGPMTCDEKTAADFLKASAYHSYINNQPGFMWWCACEQSMLKTPPYEWNMMERELGLFDKDGEPKETLKALKEVSNKINSFDFKLSSPKDDVVCITSQSQDNWGISYMSYALARKSGLSLGFAYSEYEIPDAEAYMLPSVSGEEIMPREKYFELKKRVFEGADLYISSDNGFLTEFSELCGLRVLDTRRVKEKSKTEINGYEIDVYYDYKRILEPVGAEILACDSEGNPVVSVNKYGKGNVYYVNFPPEKTLLDLSDAFDYHYDEVFKTIFKSILAKKSIKTWDKYVKISFHNNKAVLFNYSNEKRNVKLFDKNNIFIGEIECKPYDIEIIDIKSEKRL